MSLSEVALSPPINRGDLLERFGGDEPLVNEIVRIFLEDCPKRLVDIKAAVDARDPEGIRLSAHALKGAAGNLSAMGLFEAARTLESIGCEQQLDEADAAWRRLQSEALNVLLAMKRFEASAPSTESPEP